MLKCLISHALRYAEISGFSFIMLCWHFLFLLYYVIPECPNSHMLCFAEISGLSCVMSCWNICFPILRNVEICFLLNYVMHKRLISHVLRYAEISAFSCITLCWHFLFLMYYFMLKCLISHVLLYADISLKAEYYLSSLILHTFNLYIQEIFYSKEFRKNVFISFYHFS